MKRFLILFTIIIPFVAKSQDDLKIKSKKDYNKILIGISFSSDFNYRTLKKTDENVTTKDIFQHNNATETFKLGYTTGLNICYNFSNTIGIEAGVQYSNKGYRTKEMNFSGTNLANDIKTKLRYNYYYIDLPTKVNFTFGQKKIRLFTSIGASTNFFIKNINTTIVQYSDNSKKKYSQNTVGKHQKYNKIYISPLVSLGINYKLNEKFNLRVESIFRYGILPINYGDPIKGYLWNGGLNLGLYYGL
jgi:hypothetical protein